MRAYWVKRGGYAQCARHRKRRACERVKINTEIFGKIGKVHKLYEGGRIPLFPGGGDTRQREGAEVYKYSYKYERTKTQR